MFLVICTTINEDFHKRIFRLRADCTYYPSSLPLIMTAGNSSSLPTELTPLGAHKKIIPELCVRPKHLSQLPCGMRLYCLET